MELGEKTFLCTCLYPTTPHGTLREHVTEVYEDDETCVYCGYFAREVKVTPTILKKYNDFNKRYGEYADAKKPAMYLKTLKKRLEDANEDR